MNKKLLALLAVFLAVVIISLLGAYVVTRGAASGITFKESVAVIKISGEISLEGDSGVFGGSAATPEKINEQLREAERDGSVKAILLEINSPGGSFVASEEIADAVKKAEKPVVAWLGEMATSGAYYAASAADYVVADKGTLTGSIGVIFVFPQYEGLLEKLGVEMRVVKSGKYKDIGSPYRNMTEEEKATIQEWADDAYGEFLADVAENRNFTKERIEELAEGKIYTGKKAVELKLADQIGTREDAIKIAAHLGNIKGEPGISTYERRGFFEEFMRSGASSFGYGFAKGLVEAGDNVKMVRE